MRRVLTILFILNATPLMRRTEYSNEAKPKTKADSEELRRKRIVESQKKQSMSEELRQP